MESQTEIGRKLPALKVLTMIVALGVITLGAIFLIVFSQKKGSQKSQNSASIPNVSNQQEEGKPPESPAGMAVLLSEVGGSGQSGIAVIGEKDGKILVALGISGASKGSVEPVHIHTGSCSGLGDVKYPLKDVVGDSSETTLDFGIDKLRNELPLALNVHKSASEQDISVACGDIK